LADPLNDVDGDGIPDYYSWFHFGHQRGWANENSRAQDDYDLDGVSNGDEYTNSTDPNSISFSLNLGNRHFNSTNAPGRFIVNGGVPSVFAVLVNNENVDHAEWRPFTTNFTFMLGPTNGEHEVFFGLRGRMTNSEATWLGTTVSLDVSNPVVIVTYPTNGVVTRPILQLRGYSPEPLSTVKFGISNAADVATNELGFLTGSDFDMDTLKYSTNYFQCFDIGLVAGTNLIALSVTDKAGNMTTTNFSVLYDYTLATNPPAVQITWPTNGTEVAGDSLTLDGFVDDPAATVVATIIGTNGVTNIVAARIEREGKFWIEGLPLVSGTNFVSLTATNLAGMGTATNLTLIHSDLVITLDPLPDDLWTDTVSVSGTISDASYSVWVNGKAATVGGDGHWVADDVPVTRGSTASFTIKAYSPTEPQP
jgi:hypothetical protein